MKKSTFVAMILGTIGGILFALGMCMEPYGSRHSGNCSPSLPDSFSKRVKVTGI